MAAVLSTSVDLSSKKRALIIGNNNYAKGLRLRYCINNARDLHEKLHTINFQVILGLDLICEQMDSMIEDFVSDISPGDFIFFFFSGYGIHFNSQNFLVPIDDDQITSCEMFNSQTVNLKTIFDMIVARRPSATIFVLDSSRSYIIPNGLASTVSIDYGGLYPMQSLPGSLITFVSDAEKILLDKSTNGQNTIYIAHLLDYIIQVNLPIDEMFDLISTEIMADTDHEQCPFRSSSLRKNVFFNNQAQAELSQRRSSQLEQSIAESQNHSLVDLRHQQLTDRDIKFIIQQVIVNKQCTRLWLGANRITRVGASIIASALNSNVTLERLYLSGNCISDIGVKYLSKTLSINNNTLKILALQENGITDLGVEYLAEMLKTNKTLTGLWLDNNDISDKGVRLLANALQSQSSKLEYLDLSKNRLIGDLSLEPVQDIIKNSRWINELSIYDCNLSRSGKEKLKKAAKLKKNFSVNLNSWNE